MKRRRDTALLALPLLWLTGCASEQPFKAPVPLITTSPFEYPVELWDQGIAGETVLLVRVTADGSVDSAYVYKSSGHPQFDSAAVAGARKLRFAPAQRGDKRVESWARLPVRFSKEGAQPGEALQANP
jgi:TonB family protein